MPYTNKTFDVFFSHSHSDKESVEYIANRLEIDASLSIWLDKWKLIPGETFHQAIYQGLDKAKSCAVFFGKDTSTGWIEEEINKAIDLHVKDRSFRVIPVLLPGAKKENVNGFLESRTWVDFKKGLDDPEALHCLTSGIRGEPPGNFKSNEKIKNANKVNVEIIMDKNFESFDEHEQKKFINAIRQFLSMGSDIVIKNLGKGSVKLTIELEEELAQKLVEGVQAGIFNKYNVTNCRIIDKVHVSSKEDNLDKQVSQSLKSIKENEIIAKPISTGKVQVNSKKSEENLDKQVLQSLQSIVDDEIITRLNSPGIEQRKGEEELYRRYTYFIREVMRKYKLAEDELFDIYSDTIITTIERIRNGIFKGQSLLKTYIFQLFQNKCNDFLRKSYTSKKSVAEMPVGLPDAANSVIQSLIEKSEQQLIAKKLQQMNENCRRLLLLYADGYADKEIAEILSFKSAASVKTSRLRCMKKLRALLSDKM